MKTEYKYFERGYWISNTGKVKRDKRGEIEKPKLFTDCGNYLYFVMFGHKNKKAYVHRAVAKLFVDGWTKQKYYVDHIDGDRQNNRADNLRYVTPKENQKNRVIHDLPLNFD
jgi:hypothetical protein